MNNSLLVVTPPLIVLFLAVTTRNVLISLCTGITAATLIATSWNVLDSIDLLVSTLKATLLDSHNLATFGFLCMLGALTLIISEMGGIKAYTRAIQNYIKNKKAAEATSLIFSHFFFIDDYINSLTVGSIMRPITDKFSVPRAKLAYLLDAMSGSLCLLIPASSWLAIILPQLKNSGISASMNDKPLIAIDPFSAYIESIPYIFYALFSILSVWLCVLTSSAYGPMASHEKAAAAGNLFNGKKELLQETDTVTIGALSYFILPLGSFITFIVTGIAFAGNHWLMGGKNSFIETIQEADILYVLFFASLLSVISSSIFFIIKKKTTLQKTISSVAEGALFMQNSIITLSLAWTFAALLKNNLKTGEYLAEILLGSLDISLLPAMFFVTAALIAAATGSSWSTINIMLPLAIPMIHQLYNGSALLLPTETPILFPSLGGLFSGSLAGAHLSPISDTTITASTSASCYHMDHIKTQAWYLIAPLCGTLFAYITIGLLQSTYLALPLAIASGVIPITLFFFRQKTKKDGK